MLWTISELTFHTFIRMATASTTIYRPYSYKYQPRCINLKYIAEMSFLASNSTSNDIAQSNMISNSKKKKNVANNKTESKPAKKDSSVPCQEKESHSPKCWSWLTDDKDFDGIIETTRPFEKRHEHFGSKNPLLCIVNIPSLKKFTQKITSRKRMSESRRDRCTFPSIDQAKPILGGDEDESSDNQEADSIDPRNVDAFIREDDASWNENLSVVEMHEWLPSKPISLQLMTSDSQSIKKSFGDDASFASFDLEAFNANHFSANNVFRQSGYEIITTPSTVPDTSFFSDCDSNDDDKEETEASDGAAPSSKAKEEKRPKSETDPTSETTASPEGIRVDIQGLLNITQSNSFDTVEFYEEDEERLADDSDTTSAYFSSDNLTQVHPHIVPSVSSSVASSIMGSEAGDLLSIPSFPSSSSWDGDEDGDQFVFQDQDAEAADENNFDQEELTTSNGISTTEAAYFSCFKFGGFLSLMT